MRTEETDRSQTIDFFHSCLHPLPPLLPGSIHDPQHPAEWSLYSVNACYHSAQHSMVSYSAQNATQTPHQASKTCPLQILQAHLITVFSSLTHFQPLLSAHLHTKLCEIWSVAHTIPFTRIPSPQLFAQCPTLLRFQPHLLEVFSDNTDPN